MLCSDVVVFTKATLPVAEPIGKKAAKAAPAAAEPAEAAPAAEPAPAVDEPAEAPAEAPGPYGPGSHAPLDDRSAPEGFDIKGNADSMLYHVPGSRHYARTVAEVWFATEADAEAAGFSKPASQQEADS